MIVGTLLKGLFNKRSSRLHDTDWTSREEAVQSFLWGARDRREELHNFFMHRVQSSDTWPVYREFCWGLKARQRGGGAAGKHRTVHASEFPIIPSLCSTRTAASSSARSAASNRPSTIQPLIHFKFIYKENSWSGFFFLFYMILNWISLGFELLLRRTETFEGITFSSENEPQIIWRFKRNFNSVLTDFNRHTRDYWTQHFLLWAAWSYKF